MKLGAMKRIEIQAALFQWIANVVVGFCPTDHESYVKPL
ncbi:hypothetical protein SynMITS9220_01594 [Synechococcus sp. MIT S9220]|nr:hypothetical protein SynMITS9220_01594 [Synechococcus sp. MIT S9220]